MQTNYKYIDNFNRIEENHKKLKNIVIKTPLEKNELLSEEYGCNVFLKREDLQIVRSYKIRGAYNRISNLSLEETINGIVCASAGNHSQGVAYSCYKKKIKGYIFMPKTASNQKVERARFFGKEFVEIILEGDTFDDAYQVAKTFADSKQLPFIHPFNDLDVIEGQGTVAKEIYDDININIDYILVPVGGGGLISGVSIYSKYVSPNTKIIGIEPLGAPSLEVSLKNNKVVKLENIDKFVDGAAVQKIGTNNFNICKDLVDEVCLVPEGLVCSTILKLYNEVAIVVEPAGALAIASLNLLKDKLKGKNVVCIITGSNNDISRTEEIRERAMLYEGLKHYFIINFAQRSGALKHFVNNVLIETDNITRFEYMQKNNRENGPALVGIEVIHKKDLNSLIKRLETNKFSYEYLNDNLNLLEIIL